MKKVCLFVLFLAVCGALSLPIRSSNADVARVENLIKTEMVVEINRAVDVLNGVVDANNRVGVGSISVASNKVVIGNASGVGAAVTLSGDVTSATTGAITISAGSVEASMLETALADRIAYITVTGADLASAGTGTITIQAKDAAGNDVDANVLCRTWIGTADDFGVDALTDYSVSTGTQKEEVTANGEYLAISDTNGVVVMAIDNGGAGTVYAWAELGGRVVASGAVVLTAP